MLKALVAVMAIAGVVALGVFGPGWLMSDADSSSDQTATECDLLNDTCRWEQQGTRWNAQLKKAGVKAEGTEYHLTVTTDMSEPGLLAVLRGESMYLGEYPVPMTRTGLAEDGKSQVWQARFTAPFCTTDPEMTWRIDLQADAETDNDTPVKLTFRAEGRG
ncbi:hypothetical protein [Marinobacter sp. HL-58]|uniref:hypothetical protein n=1 Tax=Marinobacter sp. HL-58 TaxID=1479237 RepID=UPI0004824B1C|nr:hypothetical protein [Marinobacter sp. HL-58]KPQ01543.1 MAG: hypothetical protein HLUCCO03_12310 [Marinobacter sp. HL-58]